MFEWLTGTVPGKLFATFVLSMMPVGELRFGLPYGIALGLDYPVALVAALLGNMIPVPFIIVYIKRIFLWMRAHLPVFNSFIARLEEKYPESEFMSRNGGQPLYSYYFSVL